MNAAEPGHAAGVTSAICLGRAGDACVVGALERVGDTLYGARVYVELGRRLVHAHAARQGRPDTLSQLVLHAWPAVGPRGRGLAPFRHRNKTTYNAGR